MTYSCPHCGAPCLTQAEANGHCRSDERCPRCGGTGIIAGGFGSPNQTCTACGGSGRR